MTNVDETTPAPPPGDAPRRQRTVRKAVLIGAVVAVVVAGGIAVALARGDDDSDGAQLDAVQQACRDWMSDQGSPAGSDATWCSDMTSWMQGRMHGGRMMGSAMWGDPERMRSTCNQWMATGPAAAVDDPEGWCDDMVDWMAQRADDGGWMHG